MGRWYIPEWLVYNTEHHPNLLCSQILLQSNFHLLGLLSFQSIFFCFVVLPSSTYLFTVGVEGFWFLTWSHSTTHHIREDSSGRGIGPVQRHLPETSTWKHKHCTRQISMPPVGFVLYFIAILSHTKTHTQWQKTSSYTYTPITISIMTLHFSTNCPLSGKLA
jgi:hypothetical protein